MSQLRNYFLGPFRVTHNDNSVVGFESDKTRALLAYLVVEADQPHRREALAALLWPDQPDSVARQNLRQALYVVRQALDGGQGLGIGDQGSEADGETLIPVLVVSRQTVQFNPESDAWCDVWLFSKLLAACKAHGHQQPGHSEHCTECIERLQQATELYRGAFLQGFAVTDTREFEEWMLLERETLHRQMMHTLGQLADYCEFVGEHEQALHYALLQLKLEPWLEEAHRQTMRLLSRTGQRSAALAQYETCRQVLFEELGVEPARETTSLYERIRDSETEQLPERPVVGKSLLPVAYTPLIGREAEVTTVVEQLLRDEVKLLTVTGPGGVGKTRIAIQAAAALQEHFADGICFVNLAPITDPGLVAAQIASALGVNEMPEKTVMEVIVSYLQGKQVLLLLDNFEQVAEGAPLIAQLIQSGPGVKALVTSRMALGLRGTQEYPIPPMSLPAASLREPWPDRVRLPALERVAGYEGIRLFVARAAAVKPDFEITGNNAPAIVEICHRLDGLPLAIELAAARIKVLSPQAMLTRLQNRLELIASKDRDVPTRQQTLRNTIEWSYDLLEEGEKQLFRRMAVFQGGRTLEALEAVCNYDEKLQVEVLGGVESLISKSLLQQRDGQDGEPRFWMLETIHEFAHEKLAENGEAEASTLQKEHARYYMELAEEAEPQLRVRWAEWCDRLEEEHDNIREALRWAKEGSKVQVQSSRLDENDFEPGRAEVGLRIAGALWRFWWMREHYSEGREQLAGVLFLSNGIEHDTERTRTIKANALHGAGVLACEQGDYTAARPLYEESLAIRRELGDKGDIANSLNNLGIVAYTQGDYASARSLYGESLAIKRELGDKTRIAESLNNLGIVAYAQGDYASARSVFEEGLAIFRESNSKVGAANVLSNLGNMAIMQGDYASARSWHEESLALRREVEVRGGVAESLNSLGHLAHRQGDVAVAQQLYMESLSMSREMGAKVWIMASLIGLGAVANTAGQPAMGAKLLGAVEALVEDVGAMEDPVDRAEYERGVASCRAQLDGAAFEQAWAEGHAMSMEQAIAYALKDAIE